MQMVGLTKADRRRACFSGGRAPPQGKKVALAKRETATARTSAKLLSAWRAKVQSWSSQLSSRAGKIVPFATRKILLLLTLYAMDLPAVKAGIELCEFGTHLGVKGMTGAFNVVHNMMNASVSLLSSI